MFKFIGNNYQSLVDNFMSKIFLLVFFANFSIALRILLKDD